MKQGPFAQAGCVVPAVNAPTTPSDCRPATPPLPVHGYRRSIASRPPQARSRDGSPQFRSQPCDRSDPPTPGSSWAPAPGPKVPSVAFTLFRRARLSLVPPSPGGVPVGAAGFTSCYGPATRHLSQMRGLTPRFDRKDLSLRRGPRYQGPWRLPGPNSHRLADLSFTLGLNLSHHLPFLSESPRATWAHLNEYPHR